MTQEALKLALEALENSVDLVVEDAYNAEQLYGNYPTRQGKVGGLKILADQHKEAITAIKEVLAQPEQEPVAWQTMEAKYPTLEKLDIRMGDGSILCSVWPQSDGDLWWEGSGTGEKFIDPKYANVTHWRVHSDTTPPQRTWVGLTDDEIAQGCKESWVTEQAWQSAVWWAEEKLKEKNT